MESNYLTIPQAAKRCPLTEATLRKMRDNKTLPGFFVGNRFLVNFEKLMALLEESTDAKALV